MWSHFTKIRLVGAKLFLTDGRTDRHDEANSLFFSKFCAKRLKMRAAAPHLPPCVSMARCLLNILTFWHRSFTFNSNKSPSWRNNFSVYYPDVCLQLNMFRAFYRPSSGAQWLQWQPLVLPFYRGDSRTVFMVGLATNVRIIKWKIAASGWWFIWIKCKTPVPKG